MMQRKRSTSITQRKNSKKKPNPAKKKACQMCCTNGLVMLVQKSLFRKYSEAHFSQLTLIDSYIQQKPQKNELQKQYMQKYYKNIQRKHEFPKIKQLYKLYQETPRLYMPNIREIIAKCYHRKRLLEYFKLAKILGIRVDTVKFSTFMLSLSKSKNMLAKKKSAYDPLIGHISGYEFSEDVQRQLIETLSGKQNNPQQLNPQSQPLPTKSKTQSRPNLINLKI